MMRRAIPLIAACVALAACSHRHEDPANALDNAAAQSHPAAAAELQNQANEIRANGSDANLADPNSPAQNAMQAAGNAAANSSTSQPQ